MENIEDFNRGAGLIFSHLYQQFPVPCMLQVGRMETKSAGMDEARYGRRLRVYTATVQFLAEEGFIRFGSSDHDEDCGSFADAVLTSKGLAVLSKSPESLEKSRSTVGDALVSLSTDLLKQGSWEGIVALVRMILGG